MRPSAPIAASSVSFLGVLAAVLLPVAGLHAGSHLWKIGEVFSNRDGSVQFIELHECCGASAELYLRGLELTSQATDSVFTFPRNLSGSTSNRYLLLATPAFAALPGAPAPDFVIPEGFIGTDGDLLWYSEARRYDSFRFRTGDLPADGVASIQVTDFVDDVFTTGTNSPTNYAGATGSIDASDAPFRRGDCNDDGARDISDPVFLLGSLFLSSRRPGCSDSCDANDDGGLDIADAIAELTWLFLAGPPLAASMDCGGDPTEDKIGCGSFSGC